MMTLWQDMRYGVRMLAKNPGFAVVAVLTLAIGIGATTAVFSVIDTLILNPLPQEGPGQLVCLTSIDRYQGRTSFRILSLTLEQIIKRDVPFSEICYFNTGWTMRCLRDDFFEEVRGARVSTNFVGFWNAKPLLGRGFLPNEGDPGQDSVIILSYRFWNKHYGSDRNILGQTIRFENGLFTVVGVMSRHFRFPEEESDFWIPSSGFQNGRTSYGVVARLRPGVSRGEAEAAIQTALSGHLDAAPRYYRERYNVDIDVAPLRSLFILSMGDAYGFLEKVLISVFGAVIFVLLIGCVNTANLLLSQMETRQQEVAVRVALGAGRSRLARQFLTESSLLALLGGLAGVGLSWWLLHILVISIPWYIPRVRPIELNLNMLAFTLAVSLLVGLLVGLAPVLQACGKRLESALKQSGAGLAGSPSSGWFRNSMVVAEVSLAVTLLVGAGLTTRSVVSMLNLDPGFEPPGLLQVSMRLWLPYSSNSRERIGKAKTIVEQLAALPGVESAGIRVRELGMGSAAPEGETEGRYVAIRGVSVESRDTLKTLNVRLLAGRYLGRSDAHISGRTILVNEKLAEDFWPGQNAVGKKLRVGSGDDRTVLEVVGVVSDVLTSLWGLWGNEAYATAYRPSETVTKVDDLVAFYLRTRDNPSSLIPAVRNELKEQGMARSSVEFSVVAEDLYNSTAVPRLLMTYVSGFATVGLVLAAIGIYGVLSYSVVRRTHEVGIRMTLGAQRKDVLGLVIGRGLVLILAGLLIGTMWALAVAHVLGSILYGVAPTDPVTFAVVSLLFTAVGLTACYIPARRATKIDPMMALRYE